jgi:AcrR family transcriptional regulator
MALPSDRLSRRGRQIVEEARALLESEGAEGLTMRRLAERLGIRAPSLYKHFPDKQAVEVELVAEGRGELAETHGAAAGGGLAGLGAAFRRYALEHPHLYRLMTTGPLPRDRLPAGLEDRAAAPLVAAAGDPHLARAAWAFAHGMVLLELDGRFPPGADLDTAWRTGLAAMAGAR